MARAKRFLRIALCFALVLVLGGEVILSAFSLEASAAETAFDINTSDPLDDLAGSTIDGNPFNTSDYDPTISTDPELVLLYEYGFSPSNLSHYGLYVYVFYPTGRYVEELGNTINLGFTKNGTHTQYSLKYLNCTKDPNMGGFFYKFKVDFSEEQRKDIWYNDLNNNERVYNVGEIELAITDGTRKSIEGKTYVYSGYMQGLTEGSAEESTLTCKMDELKEVLELEVHPTYYRFPGINNAQGTEYESVIDAQTTLHSVYFAVPNDMIRKYGEMTAVTATWREALLNPALVVGNETLYNAFSALVDEFYYGVPSDWSIKQCPYYFRTDYKCRRNYGTSDFDGGSAYHYCGYSFNDLQEIDSTGYVSVKYYNGKQMSSMRMIYPTLTWGIDAADHYDVDRNIVHNYVLQRSEELLVRVPSSAETVILAGGKRYYKGLFETIGEQKTESITIDDNYSLTGAVTEEYWWSWLLGLGIEKVEKLEEKNLQAIQKVTDVDVLGAKKEIVCDALCIAESDYDHFSKFYLEKTRNSDNTVYLFRYRTANYYAEEATFFCHNGGDSSLSGGTNGYVFQMPVDLDFDVIDVTLTKNGVDTVIPVLSEAQNIFHDVTPPLNTTSDVPFWQQESFETFVTIIMIILGMVMLVVIVCALGYAFTYVMQFLQVPLNWLASQSVRISGLYQQHKHRANTLRKSWNDHRHTYQNNRRRRK